MAEPWEQVAEVVGCLKHRGLTPGVVVYEHHNSHNREWVSKNGVAALARARWSIIQNGGSLAYALKWFPAGDLESAIAEWEKLTGCDAEESGCECCGAPHHFEQIGQAK